MSEEDAKKFQLEFRYISQNNDLDKLKILLDKEKDPNVLMMFSAMYYNLTLIKFLVQNGLDIHCEDDYVFRLSCRHNKEDITKYVISLAKRDAYEYYINYALVAYSQNGNIDFVKEMIDMGGDISHQNNEAIIWAGGFGHIDMVKYLMENGANINARFNMSLRMAQQNKHIKMVDYIQSLDF